MCHTYKWHTYIDKQINLCNSNTVNTNDHATKDQ